MLLEHAENYCFTAIERERERQAGEKGPRGGGGEGKGRKLINSNHRALRSRGARKIGQRDCASYSFAYDLIRYSQGEKSHVRAHGMATDGRCEISRAPEIFDGGFFHECIRFHPVGERSPFPPKTNAIKISSCVTGDAKETEGIGSER